MVSRAVFHMGSNEYNILPTDVSFCTSSESQCSHLYSQKNTHLHATSVYTCRKLLKLCVYIVAHKQQSSYIIYPRTHRASTCGAFPYSSGAVAHDMAFSNIYIKPTRDLSTTVLLARFEDSLLERNIVRCMCNVCPCLRNKCK